MNRGWPTKRELAATYDAAAAKYTEDFGDSLKKAPFDCALLDRFAARTSGCLVADIGCGPGQAGEYLCGRGLRVVGVDLSKQMARRAHERTNFAVVADLARLPFASASFGGLVAFYSIICTRRDEVPSVLAEFRRVLSAAAPLIMSFHVGHGEEHHGTWAISLFQPEEMIRYAQHAGLKVVACEERPPYAFERQGSHAYLLAQA